MIYGFSGPRDYVTSVVTSRGFFPADGVNVVTLDPHTQQVRFLGNYQEPVRWNCLWSETVWEKKRENQRTIPEGVFRIVLGGSNAQPCEATSVKAKKKLKPFRAHDEVTKRKDTGRIKEPRKVTIGVSQTSVTSLAFVWRACQVLRAKSYGHLEAATLQKDLMNGGGCRK